MRSSLWVLVLSMGCGARVVIGAERDGGNEGVDAATVVDAAPPAVEDAPALKPVFDTSTPEPDTRAPSVPDTTEPMVPMVTCAEGPATGPPGGCSAAFGCSSADTLEYARAKIACYVDRCAIESTGKPWCGTMMLKLGADGCTADYSESGPGLGGCVKYQGFYRRWPCAAGQTIVITRPCP